MPVYKKHNGKPVVGYSGSELGYTDPIVTRLMHWYYQNSDGSPGKPLSLKQENDMLNRMDYEGAKKIRKKSFGTMLAEHEGTLGESFKAAISKKTKAKITGIKETFDPLNIAKKLTGGSNWAPAMLGKMFGVDKNRVDYFSGVKPKHTASLESGSASLDSPEALESLGYIYKSLKQSIDDKHQAEADDKESKQKEDEEEDTRNEELIEALTGRKKKKEKPYRDEKGRFAKQPKEEKTRTTTNIPKGIKVPKTTTSIPTSSSVGTAVKVAGTTIVGVAVATTASRAIAGAESGNNYDITFGDRVVNGKIQNVKGYPTPEELFGKKLTELSLSEVKEFGRIRSQKSKNSGATGKYQFMPTTLFGYDKGGKHIPGLVDKLGLPMDTKFSPEIQDKLQDLLHTQDVTELKRQGVPITPGYEYMAHYIGAGGAAVVYRSASRGENIPVAQALINAGLTAPGKENNPELYTITTTQFESVLAGRLAKQGFASPHTVSGSNSGSKLDASSKENKDLKTESNESDKSTQIVNSNTNNQKTQHQSSSGNQGDDRNPYTKKVQVN